MNEYSGKCISENVFKRNDKFPKISIVTVVYNRKDKLYETINSVINQTYSNIDYVIIDGGSTDGTIELIKEYDKIIGAFVSEDDEGIYDAINKGIEKSCGDYVVILHAGDLIESDFIERSVAELQTPGVDPLRTITYSSYRHGEKAMEAKAVTAGLYLHHFGVNHSTFLVPKALYETIGTYDPNLKIVSDAIWMRRALDFGCDFRKIDGYPLYFDTGGASSAQSERQRNLVISEWVASYRIYFSFLPEPVAQAIYLYRFDETSLHAISIFLKDCRGVEDQPRNWSLFLEATALLMRHIWSLRPLKISKDKLDAFQASLRMDVAEWLDIPLEETNFQVADQDISEIIHQLDVLAERLAGQHVVLHFLEVFSRPSETFVPDVVNALDARDNKIHLIVCEQRLLAEERPYPYILIFPFEDYPRRLAKRLMEGFLDRLNIREFVFHFAINGWRFLGRIDPKYRRIPALYMTHGIDVVELVDESAYRKFIIDGVARLPNVRFTAVSEYLKGKLLDVGVPDEKIAIVHNAIHGRFWENRTPGRAKAVARRESAFDVRLVNIGRLISVKGHQFLISAIRRLKEDFGLKAHLTIVWGGHGPLLENIEQQIASEGLQDQIHLIESVNFDEEPGFFDQFDMFVSSSIETEGRKSRAEAFGIANLEAIAAGLPIVASDAGGQAEVLGSERRYARLAKAKSSESLAREIADLCQSGILDEDNADYAKERLSHFSRDRQIDLILEALTWKDAPALSAALFSTSVDRGAGGGAYKVHKSLLSAGIQSQINCLERAEDFSSLIGVNAIAFDAYDREKAHQPDSRELYRNHTIFSLDPEGLAPEVLADVCSDADVINLHWYARFLSNANIAVLSNLGKPLVITLRDMHPLTGGCHYSHGCEEWRRSCAVCAQIPRYRAEIPHRTLLWKLNNWNLDNITLVALSEFSRKMIQESRLFGDCRVEVIPNPVEADLFKPLPVQEAREEFGISPDAKVVAYLPSYSSSIKGAKEAMEVLKRLPPFIDGRPVELLVAGASSDIEDLPYTIQRVGYISDRRRLAQLFSATNVTLVPSLAETFSNTVQESLACGTPVAGFRTGAIPEMAAKERGGCAELGDVISLTKIVQDLLAKDEKPVEACRRYVMDHHSEAKVAKQYADLFQELVAEPPKPKTDPSSDEKLRELQRRYLADRLALAKKQVSSASSKTSTQSLDKTFEALSLGANVSRRGGRIIVEKGEARHVTYGPYLKPEVGAYDIAIKLARKNIVGLSRSRVVFEVAMNGSNILLQETIPLPLIGRRKQLNYRFNYSEEIRAANEDGLEFRLWSDGKERFEMIDFSLRRN